MPSRPHKTATSDDLRRDFSRRLGEVARLWRGVLDRELRAVDLSFMQWLTLSQLDAAEVALVQKALAARVGIEGPAMVAVLDRLVAGGLVERRVSITDRRANTVHLTRAGKDRLGAAQREHQRVPDVQLENHDQAELTQGTPRLGRVAARAMPNGDQ
jgi:MarR family transcriptional regulator for hemolysin